MLNMQVIDESVGETIDRVVEELMGSRMSFVLECDGDDDWDEYVTEDLSADDGIGFDDDSDLTSTY